MKHLCTMLQLSERQPCKRYSKKKITIPSLLHYTPVSTHTKTTRTQTSVPTSMINITCFVIVVKYLKFKVGGFLFLFTTLHRLDLTMGMLKPNQSSNLTFLKHKQIVLWFKIQWNLFHIEKMGPKIPFQWCTKYVEITKQFTFIFWSAFGES